MTSEPVRSSDTGHCRTPNTSRASSTGAAGIRDQLRRLTRKPMPMPRNEPSSTKFEKYDRCTMFEPSQRMSASSRNSISALPRTRRRTTAPSAAVTVGTLVVWPMRAMVSGGVQRAVSGRGSSEIFCQILLDSSVVRVSSVETVLSTTGSELCSAHRAAVLAVRLSISEQ